MADAVSYNDEGVCTRKGPSQSAELPTLRDGRKEQTKPKNARISDITPLPQDVSIFPYRPITSSSRSYFLLASLSSCSYHHGCSSPEARSYLQGSGRRERSLQGDLFVRLPWKMVCIVLHAASSILKWLLIGSSSSSTLCESNQNIRWHLDVYITYNQGFHLRLPH